MRARPALALAVALALLGAVWAGPGGAQDGGAQNAGAQIGGAQIGGAQDAGAQIGGLRFTLDVAQRLVARSNPTLDPAGGRDLAQAVLGFSATVQDSTRSQTFLATLAGQVQRSFALDGGGGVALADGLVNPSVTLRYGRQGPRAALTATAAAARVDLAQDQALGDTDAALGTRTDLAAALALGFGLDSRVRWGLAVGHRAARFDGAPGAADRQRTDLQLSADLALSPVADLALALTGVRFDAAGGAARRTRRLDAGLTLRRPDGALTAALRVEDTPDGTRTALRLGRSLDRPGLTLRTELGLARGVTGTSRLVGALDLRRGTPDGALDLRLSRDLTARPEDDAETLTTRATLDLSRAVSGRDTLVFGLGLSETAATGSRDTFRDLLASVTLRRDLGDGWRAEAGLGWRRRAATGEEAAREATVFLGLAQRIERAR